MPGLLSVWLARVAKVPPELGAAHAAVVTVGKTHLSTAPVVVLPIVTSTLSQKLVVSDPV
jgi:hypothetical protein